ncbi:MAG: hypothetical protein ACXVBE_17270 [Bdellovibrionota bacterium]
MKPIFILLAIFSVSFATKAQAIEYFVSADEPIPYVQEAEKEGPLPVVQASCGFKADGKFHCSDDGDCGFKADNKFHCGSNCGFKADNKFHCGSDCGFKADGNFWCEGD